VLALVLALADLVFERLVGLGHWGVTTRRESTMMIFFLLRLQGLQ
jgi:hypothetical protein